MRGPGTNLEEGDGATAPALARRSSLGSPFGAGLCALALASASAPLLAGSGSFEVAHLAVIVVAVIAGLRLALPDALLIAVLAEALLAGQRVAEAASRGEPGDLALALVWMALGPLAAAGSFHLSEGPHRRAIAAHAAAGQATTAALAEALATADAGTADHCGGVVALAEAVARRMGLTEHDVGELRLAAALHDVGKLAVPESILCKAGPLDAEEWRCVRRHPDVGADLLARLPALAHLAPIVRAMHERIDGDGYPQGLRGTEIPLAARIVFCCDAFEAMTADRPYRRALRVEDALAEIRRCSGTQFDPVVASALVAEVGGREVADGRGEAALTLRPAARR